MCRLLPNWATLARYARRDSNPHCGRFKCPASYHWATRARAVRGVTLFESVDAPLEGRPVPMHHWIEYTAGTLAGVPARLCSEVFTVTVWGSSIELQAQYTRLDSNQHCTRSKRVVSYRWTTCACYLLAYSRLDSNQHSIKNWHLMPARLPFRHESKLPVWGYHPSRRRITGAPALRLITIPDNRAG